jgi:uncharacterized phage protein (TIGR02220 family)
MEGWIKLHKRLLEWEWYTDQNTKSMFIHCLLSANYCDKDWRGKKIERGSFVASLHKLSIETGLSVKQVRISLSKLKNTRELIIKGASQWTKITVCNYESYQGEDTEEGQANGQKKDTQRATTKEYKKEEEVNNIILFLNEKLKSGFKLIPSNQKWISARFNDGFSPDDLKLVVDFKVMTWKDNVKMKSYLRPETLFGNKFDGYLQEAKRENHTPIPTEQIKLSDMFAPEYQPKKEDWK